MAKGGRGGADGYVEEGSEEVEEMEWEGGVYDGDEWDAETGAGAGDMGESDGGGAEVGAGDIGAVGGAPGPGGWQQELATPAQKDSYLRTVIGITGPKSSSEYRNAYRYISLIASGAREPRGEKWGAVRTVAEINREQRERELPPPREPGRRTGPGSFRVGDYLTGSVSWQMQNEGHRREVSGTVTLEARQVELANNGQLGRAFISAYLNGGLS